MTAPSNANTSGLIAEIDAEMEGRQRGYADVRGDLLFRCRDALVTAASAQARIAELEAELSQANANGASHWSRATTAEARADRLKADKLAIISLIEGACKLPPQSAVNTLREATRLARAALQQETQP